MTNVVGERYQITIDKKIRDELGIEPGDRAVERIEDGRLVVTFVPKPHSRSLLGILRRARRPSDHRLAGRQGSGLGHADRRDQGGPGGRQPPSIGSDQQP